MVTVALAGAGVVGCGQLSATSGPADTAAGDSPPAAASETPRTTLGPAPRIAVLGGEAGGPYGVWTYDSGAGWLAPLESTQMTAIGRDESSALLAGPAVAESRALAGFPGAQSAPEKTWQLDLPAGKVASVSRSQAGKLALVIAEESGFRFVVEGASGGLVDMLPAPRDPFSPLAAWLDDGRLLALSVDARQISRLCAIDPTLNRSDLLGGVSGVRVFAVSADGRVIAAATEDAVYVAAASTWTTTDSMTPAVELPGGRVVWNLALDVDGQRLALMSGQVGPGGAVSAVRETAYELTSSGWQRLFEVELPFAEAAGQIWLG